MTKHKQGFLFQIISICLCIAAIAIGVYSIMQGQLNISGNIGFTMHDCMVTVEGRVKNVALMDENGSSASMGDMEIKKTIMGADSATINTLNLQDLYFCEFNDVDNPGSLKVYDLIFELTFTNVCDFLIKAQISKPTTSNSTISVYDYNTNTVKYSNYTDFSGDVCTKYIKAKESTTIRFALHLNNKTQISNLVTFNMKLDFSEYSKTSLEVKKSISLTSSDSADYAFVNAFPYYIVYGANTNGSTETPLQWHIVGKTELDSNNDEQVVALEASDLTQLATGKLDANVNYVMLSRYVLSASATNGTYSGISWQNEFFYCTSGSAQYRASYLTIDETKEIGVNVPAYDYSYSNIRKYLNNNSVKTGYSVTTGITYNYSSTSSYDGETYSADNVVANDFLSFYGLDGDILNLISARSLQGLYVKIGTSSSETADGSKASIMADEMFKAKSDLFWLLSYNEINDIFGSGSDYSKMLSKDLISNSCVDYWLRTPGQQSYGWGMFLNSAYSGSLNADSLNLQKGVRPAFII